MKVEIFDLMGSLLWQEVNLNAAAGTYRFDISRNCLAANVYVIKAAINRSEVSFRYVAFKGGQDALASFNTASAYSGTGGLKAMAAVVDTIKVTASGFQTKSVPITSLDNQQQNITLDSINGKAWPTANPTAKGPFEVAADKNVGPLAGIANDPIYGQQRTLRPAGTCTPSSYGQTGTRTTPRRILRSVSLTATRIGADSISPWWSISPRTVSSCSRR